MELALDAMALDLVRLHPESENLIVMGMATRGIPLAGEITKRLEQRYGKPVLSGELDASFYRDDFHYRNHFGNPVMRVLKTPTSVEGKTVVLVDDVLYTGRSVRAAMQAVFDLGRPAAIRLCCLVDRGNRELPIAPDCIGLKIDTPPGEEVRVRIIPHDNENSVYLVKVGEAK